jgi:multimeric flavodoxin WrbA
VNKIITLCGSNRRSEQSNSYKTAKIIEEKLLQRNRSIQNEIICLADYRIDMCLGCASCFKTGKCIIQDEMDDLKKILLGADHILMISPVYAHHIPGILKNSIDRISYWMHTMQLLGKTSSCVAVTSNNGQIYVSDYLEKILKFMGTIYICGLEITIDHPPMLKDYSMETGMLIDGFIDKVAASLTGGFPLYDLEIQISAFKQYKELHSSPESQGFEGNAWKTWPELLHGSFLDAFQYKRLAK